MVSSGKLYMQLIVSKTALSNPEFSLRRAGYAIHIDRRTREISFIRRLDRDLFPRFHLYVRDNKEDWLLNLHLDQRAPVYAGVTAHSGEYDGVVVEKEMGRIAQHISTSTLKHNNTRTL